MGIRHPKGPSVSVTILTAETKYWTTATSLKKGLRWRTVGGYSLSWQVGMKWLVTLGLQWETGRLACRYSGVFFLCFLSIQPRTLVQRMEPPVWVFPPQSNPLKIPSETYIEACLLSDSKSSLLAMKMDHHIICTCLVLTIYKTGNVHVFKMMEQLSTQLRGHLLHGLGPVFPPFWV